MYFILLFFYTPLIYRKLTHSEKLFNDANIKTFNNIIETSNEFLIFCLESTNEVPTSHVSEPTILETNSIDSLKIQVSEPEPKITNGSLPETQSDDEKSTTALSNNEEAVDELKSSTDDDAIVNSFVTVEMPPVTDPVFDSPRLDAETPSPDHESAINNDIKNDATFNHEITTAETSFTFKSSSSSDSDSIDIPDDSFIICDETNSNHVSDLLAASENGDKKDDPIFGEFMTNSDTKTSGFHVEKHNDPSDTVSSDVAVLDTDFGTEFHSSDDFFQPFTDVSTSFSNGKVTKLELDDVFRAETNDPPSDPLSTNTEITRDNQETKNAPVQFSCEFDDDDDDFSDFVSPTTFVQSKIVEEPSDPFKMQANKFGDAPMSFSGTNDFPINEKCLFEQDKLSAASEELNWTEIFCAPAEVKEK